MLKQLFHKKTFDRIFHENYSRLYLYAFHITGDAEVSRDIVSDVFTGLWNQMGRIDEKTLRAYLLTAVRNRCTDHLRTCLLDKRYEEYYLDTATELYTDDYEERAEEDRLIRRMLESLPPLTADILERCYLERKTYAESAALLGISPETVKKHIIKALRTLKKLYNPASLEES